MSASLSGFRRYPRRLDLGFTSRCNKDCFICERSILTPSDTRDFPFSALPKLASAIQHAETIGITGFGEPFLHREFEPMVRYILAQNPRPAPLSLITNGTLLSPESARLLAGRFQTLNISVNAAFSFTYGRDRGASLDCLLDRIRRFVDRLPAEDLPKLSLSFVTHRYNTSELPYFVHLAKAVGVSRIAVTHYMATRFDKVGQCVYFIPDEYNAFLSQGRERGRRYGVAVVGRRFFEEPHDYTGHHASCTVPSDQVMVRYDGSVIPCCYAPHRAVGNILDSDFESIWFGDAFRAIREGGAMDVCRSCNSFSPLEESKIHLAPLFRGDPQFLEALEELQNGPAGEAMRRRRAFWDAARLDIDLYRYPEHLFGPRFRTLLDEWYCRPTPERRFQVDTAYEEEFSANGSCPQDEYDIALGEPFFGTGWMAGQSDWAGNSWRVMGPGTAPVLYLRLRSEYGYELRLDFHTYAGHESETLTLESNGTPLTDQGLENEGNRISLRVRLPKEIVARKSGLVKIAFRTRGSAIVSGKTIFVSRLLCRPLA